MEICEEAAPTRPELLINGKEFRLLAERLKNRTYLFDGLIPPGQQLRVDGLPMAGKTSLFARLATACTTGTDFLGFKPVSRMPFVLLNTDAAAEDFFMGHVQKSWQEGSADLFDELFFSVDASYLETNVSVDLVESCIDSVKRRVGDTPGILTIDTLRSAFLQNAAQGAENDSGTMSTILRPFRTLAHKTGWTILISHHLGKASGKYAGSSAIAGAFDGSLTLRRWSSNVHRIDLDVSIRLIGEPRTLCLEDTPHGIVLLADKTTSKAAVDTISALLSYLPSREADAVPATAIDPLKTGIGKTKIRDTLNGFAAEGRHGVRKIGSGKAGDPHRFYRESAEQTI